MLFRALTRIEGLMEGRVIDGDCVDLDPLDEAVRMLVERGNLCPEPKEIDEAERLGLFAPKNAYSEAAALRMARNSALAEAKKMRDAIETMISGATTEAVTLLGRMGAIALGRERDAPALFATPQQYEPPPLQEKALSSARHTFALPFTTPAIEAVFKIINDNWADVKPGREPKQTNIAREIDAAMGWNTQKDGRPSRNAEALTALFQPEKT